MMSNTNKLSVPQALLFMGEVDNLLTDSLDLTETLDAGLITSIVHKINLE